MGFLNRKNKKKEVEAVADNMSVSGITNMSQMFAGATHLSSGTSNWITSQGAAGAGSSIYGTGGVHHQISQHQHSAFVFSLPNGTTVSIEDMFQRILDLEKRLEYYESYPKRKLS